MKVLVALVGVGLVVTVVTSRGEDGSATGLRSELDALRGEYEQRIARLEGRIRELEKQSGREVSGVDEELEAARRREMVAEQGRAAVKRAMDERFAEDTETRDLARRVAAEDVLTKRIEDVLEGYLDINGYFRAGYGRSSEDGAQQAFGIPGVAKYRLGNEAENYGELAFSKTFYPTGVFGGKGGMDADAPVARMVYRMAYYNPYENYGSGSDTEFSSPEAWASLSNVVPGMPEAAVWAGNRFYRRHDIHINDFYYWDMSGGGAGIEDVRLGKGKLAIAWIGDGAESSIYDHLGESDPENLAGFSKTNFDLRWYDWPFFGGRGELGLTYSRANSGSDSEGNKAEDADGVAVGLVRTDTGFMDEDSLNTISVQFGTGPAKTFSSGFETFSFESNNYIRPDPNESWRFRATDQLVVNPSDQWSLGGALVYQYTDFGEDAPDQTWLSGGVRPIWHFTDTLGLAFEGGVDWVSETANGNGGTLGKLTLAPQVSLGDKFFSRPVLRAYVTYAMWSDGLMGEIGGTDYADETSGWSWGVQMESWW